MMFSIDGFHAHTPHGHSTKPGADFMVAPSHSELYLYLPQYLTNQILTVPYHPAADNDNLPPELLEFHPHSEPAPLQDYFGTSMIGRALLEWNSCIGIPLDAWYTVISAIIYCAGCNRIWFFDGDYLHCDAEGNALCGGHHLGIREGDHEVPVFGKGKGRAR